MDIQKLIHSPIERNILHEHKFSIHLDKYVGVGFLGQMLSFSFLFLLKNKISKKLPNCLPTQLSCFAFPTVMAESSCTYSESKLLGAQPCYSFRTVPSAVSGASRVTAFKQESQNFKRWHGDDRNKETKLELLEFCYSVWPLEIFLHGDFF